MGQLHMEIVPRQLSDEIPHLPRLGLRTFEVNNGSEVWGIDLEHLSLPLSCARAGFSVEYYSNYTPMSPLTIFLFGGVGTTAAFAVAEC